LPPVHKLYGDFKNKGLEVRLVTFRESADTVTHLVRQRGYTLPALIDATGAVAGPLYGVVGPPTVVFVDRGGRVVGRAVGSRNWNSAAGRAFVQALLNEPAK
jgi:hypothetical protein